VSDDKYSRFRARYIKKTNTGRTGGGRTGGGGVRRRTSGTANVEPPPQTGRFRKGGPLDVTTQIVTNPRFVSNEQLGETSEYDFQTGLGTSPTELGIRDTREYEASLFDQMMASSQAETEDTQKQLEEARRDLEQSRQARRETEQFFIDEQARGNRFKFEMRGTSRDPELLKQAELLNRRIARERRLSKDLEQQQKDLDMIMRAKESGLSVAELKQQILSDMDSLDAQKRAIQEDINVLGRTEESDTLLGIAPRQFQRVEDLEFEKAVQDQIKRGLSPKDARRLVKEQLGREKRVGQFSAVGPMNEKLQQIENQQQDMGKFLSMLPESEEMVSGVEPLSESPMDSPSMSESPMMSEDEMLSSYMMSAVDPNEPAGRDPRAVTNAIDPVLVSSVQRELGRDTGSRAVAANTDTGR